MIESNKISKESLQKALETLGLVTEEVKPDTTASTVETVVKAEDAEKAKLEAELQEAIQKAEDIKAKLAAPAATPAKETTATPAINTAEIVEAVSKAFDSKVQALGLLVQSKDEKIAELSKSVETISEFNTRLAEKLQMIEKQPMDRKSLTGVKYVERFEKSGEGQSNERVISLSNLKERGELVDMIYKSVETAGFDEKKGVHKDAEFAKAIRTIEQTGHLAGTSHEAAALQNRIRKEFGITVTK